MITLKYKFTQIYAEFYVKRSYSVSDTECIFWIRILSGQKDPDPAGFGSKTVEKACQACVLCNCTSGIEQVILEKIPPRKVSGCEQHSQGPFLAFCVAFMLSGRIFLDDNIYEGDNKPIMVTLGRS